MPNAVAYIVFYLWPVVPRSRYLRMPVETALESISEELLLVKDGDGNVYWPDLGMEYINDMVPGEGYQIFMESEGTLVYPGS